MKSLTELEARHAAECLLEAIADKNEWGLDVAEAALPPGWTLAAGELTDFTPCTLDRFAQSFRALAVREG